MVERFLASSFTYAPPLGRMDSRNVGSIFLRDQTAAGTRTLPALERKYAQKRRQEVVDAFSPDAEASTAAGVDGPVPGNFDGTDIIVLQPGSCNLVLGRASDGAARTVPHVIARRVTPLGKADPPLQPSVTEPMFAGRPEEARKVLRYRLRELKIKVNPGGPQQAAQYNESVVPETIPDHNDPYKVEWKDAPSLRADSPAYFAGAEAFKLPLQGKGDVPYRLYRPIRDGLFNLVEYETLEQLRCDLVDLWTHAIETELEIPRRDFCKFRLVLVLPDIRPRGGVHAVALEAALRGCGFAAVMLQSEAVCAAFGAGLSAATVVNIGAQTSTITCVDEGMVVPASRIDLKLGGDDVARVLFRELLDKKFPYPQINSGAAWDARLMQTLAEMMLTLSEEDVVARVYDFIVRVPGRKALKYGVKVFDEPFVAALTLFYPQCLTFGWKRPGAAMRDGLQPAEFAAEDGIVQDWQRGVLFPEEQLQANGGGRSGDEVLLDESGFDAREDEEMDDDVDAAPAAETPRDGAADKPAGPAEGEEAGQPLLRCRWAGCGVEARGIGTLLAHVVDGHLGAEPRAVWPCEWEGCSEPGRRRTNYGAAVAHYARHCQELERKVPEVPIHETGAAAVEPALSNPPIGISTAVQLSLQFAAPDAFAQYLSGNGGLPVTAAAFTNSSSFSPVQQQQQQQMQESASRLQRLASGVLVVGGCASIKGLPSFLQSELRALMPGMDVTVVPPPRADLVWKGGTLMGRLELMSSSWMSLEDWEMSRDLNNGRL